MPVALAVSWICSPLAAVSRTHEAACSSSAWPFGSVPITHRALSALGQTVKCGAVTCRTCPSVTVTVTDLLVARVLHTQTANRTQ